MKQKQTRKSVGSGRGLLFLQLLASLLAIRPWEARAQSPGCIPPPEGLVAWWRGESTSLDNIGTNNGVNLGGTQFAPAKVGKGFLLSGTGDDYIELPQNLFPVPTSGAGAEPFSFEVWFKTTTSGVILGQQDSPPFNPPTNGNVPAIYVATNGTLYASLFWSDGLQLSSDAPVNDGQFHHVVVTYDGANQNLYVDARHMGSVAFVQLAYADNYWYQLGTGWSDDWPGTPAGWFPFQGIIDEASFYRRALLPSEVTGLYLAGNEGKCGGGSGGPVLLHRYSFSGSAGARVVADTVGGANGVLYYYSTTPPHTNGVPDGSGFTGTGELTLNGVNGYVLLPQGIVSSLSSVTFEAWITWRGPYSTNVWQRILDFGYSDAGPNASGLGTNYLILTPSRGGTEVFGFEETTINPFGTERDPESLILSGPGQLPIGREVFLAATYDPVAGESRLYLDGELVGSASGTFNPLNSIADRNNWLGRSQWLRDPFFNGVYKELRIWDGPLSSADIANHHASGPDQPFAPARPWLQIARSANAITIWWPTNQAAGFQLQAAGDMSGSNWSAVPNTPEQVNTSFRVTLPLNSAPAYYRLKRL